MNDRIRLTNASMTPPKVSVVVTCFNLGAYLDEAVQSVLDQTFQDIEVLIVDDGSTDEFTRELLSAYRRPRTRVIRTPNGGLSAARNVGAASTTGEYLCMLDADDRLAPSMIERSVTELDHERSLAFVSHWVRTFGDEQRDWTPTRCDLPMLLDINTVNGAALFRRTAFDAVQGFDEAMREGCEDWDFWISLLERGFQGRILPEVLFYYRRRANSMSRVMMESNRHPHLYSRLVAKHAGTYGANIEALLVRRERERAYLEQQLNDLSIERDRLTRPALRHAREDLVMAEARNVDSDAEPDESLAERDRLSGSLEDARATLTQMARANRHLEATAASLASEAAALRASWSWRITAPLRAIYGLARPAGRRRAR